ncbi:MAG: galactokinase [Chitinophagaceae bacterium]|nr:galactokinase [Chitinophagaceae bacterium]
MNNELIKNFQDRFQKEPGHIFFCPGRVNLIGEHIDYNGGSVMPCAISQGTYLAVAKNKDKRFRFHCLDFPETADLHLQESYSRTGKQWFNYPLGIINHFIQNGFTISGLDMLFSGNLPVGAGLSSSASVEVLTAFSLNSLFGSGITLTDMALLSKKVENEFMGVNCGIMDQFAVAMGKKDKAILLNCDTLEYEYIPFETGGYSLVIINTNKKRELVASKYNERFAECALALTFLKQKLNVENLCDITPASFDLNKQLINDPVLQKRALHVISENARVKDAAIALQTGDMEVFGKLMYASHQSLKELYEVTGKELDTIIDFCNGHEECIGARMTGAGFGGCAIALVKNNKVDDFSNDLSVYYQKEIGYAAGVFISGAEDGVREIER